MKNKHIGSASCQNNFIPDRDIRGRIQIFKNLDSRYKLAGMTYHLGCAPAKILKLAILARSIPERAG